MGRAPKMDGPPSTDIGEIRKQAEAYRKLQTELTEKRARTKETTGGKTAWRKACSEHQIDPVILADAVELMMKIEATPKKTTREWRIFMGYLKGLGFFEKLDHGLFDDFEEAIAAQAVDNAA